MNGWLPPHSNSECCKREGICTQQILRSHSGSTSNMSLLTRAPQAAEKVRFCRTFHIISIFWFMNFSTLFSSNLSVHWYVSLMTLLFVFLQASFRLQWGCAGKKDSRNHTHDVVSFECGNITTASRSSKQVWCLLLSC